MESKETILLIEDDAMVAEAVREVLKAEGFDVQQAREGQSGLEKASTLRPALILLDLNLPVLNGLEVCRRLKLEPATRGIRIIFMTGKGDETDIVLGLGLGGDDYIKKPFSLKELVARVQAVLRRSDTLQKKETAQRIERGGLVMDNARFEVTLNAAVVPFTLAEFRILWALLERPGIVLSRDQLIDAMSHELSVVERNVDVHVASIRKKLGSQSAFITTVRGMGYKFDDEEPAVAVAASAGRRRKSG